MAYLNKQGFGLPGFTSNSVNEYILGLPINQRILLLLPPNLLVFFLLLPLGLLRLGRRRLKTND